MPNLTEGDRVTYKTPSLWDYRGTVTAGRPAAPYESESFVLVRWDRFDFASVAYTPELAKVEADGQINAKWAEGGGA